jgi:hypothetical protein
MLSQRLIAKGQLVLDAVIDGSGDADSTALRKPFYTGCDIYPVAVDAAFLLNHISEVDPNAKMHPACFRQLRVPDPEFLLNFYRATYRTHNTPKFSEKIVSGRINHPPSVFLDKCRHQIPVCCQGSDRRVFVFPHKATVTLDIGAEDRGELSFKTFLIHGTLYFVVTVLKQNKIRDKSV